MFWAIRRELCHGEGYVGYDGAGKDFLNFLDC